MASSLFSLPDLCLMEVFKNVSLLELLRTIRLVNSRWSKLLNAELNRRRSLVIVDDRHFNLLDLQLDQYGSRLIEHVKRDDALTPWAQLPQIDLNLVNRNNRYKKMHEGPLHNHLPPEVMSILVKSLPRIRILTVVHRFVDVSALNQIIRMIDHWQGDLVSLKLCLEYESPEQTDLYSAQIKPLTIKLIDSINRLASLKHLELKSHSFLKIDEPHLTILSQLNSFDFYGIIFKNCLGKTLVRYASGNENLSKISASWISGGKLLRVKSEFCSKFTKINLYDRIETMYSMNRLCSRFTSLVHLSFALDDMAITILAKSLCQLAQLVHLSLNLRCYCPEHELHPDQIVSVSSVRLLTLHIQITSHHYTEHLHLPKVFPNVQVLGITQVSGLCVDCNYDHNAIQRGDFIVRKCAQIVRRPFRRFPRLHTIEIDYYDSLYMSRNSKKLIARDEL